MSNKRLSAKEGVESVSADLADAIMSRAAGAADEDFTARMGGPSTLAQGGVNVATEKLVPPERIWILPTDAYSWSEEAIAGDTEYIRADLHDSLVAEHRRLRELAERSRDALATRLHGSVALRSCAHVGSDCLLLQSLTAFLEQSSSGSKG